MFRLKKDMFIGFMHSASFFRIFFSGKNVRSFQVSVTPKHGKCNEKKYDRYILENNQFYVVAVHFKFGNTLMLTLGAIIFHSRLRHFLFLKF